MMFNSKRVLMAGLILSLFAATPGWAGVEHQQLKAVTALARLAFNQPATCMEGSVTTTVDWTFNPDPASAHYNQLFSGSPNQKLLARTWYYGWALRAGTAANKTEARNLLVEMFTRQDTTGHYSINTNTDEALTTSHFQLWAAGVSGAYVIALANGGVIQQNQNPYTTGDAAVRAPSRKWWLEEKKMWDLLRSYENGVARIDAPGARVIQTGPMELRDLTDMLLRGQVPSKQAQWWGQCYNASAWMMRELNNKGISPTALGTPQAGETVNRKSYDTLCAYWRGEDYVFSFPQLRKGNDPLFWTARIGGVKSYGPLQSGTPVFPATPAPSLPGSTLTQVTGLVAGAATCPQP